VGGLEWARRVGKSVHSADSKGVRSGLLCNPEATLCTASIIYSCRRCSVDHEKEDEGVRHLDVRNWMGGSCLALLAVVNSLGAQQVVELTGEDRALSSDHEEVYRVGSFDGDAWETFGEISGTAFDANGNLYIFDRQASGIVVVDGAGNSVREFGSPGEGPGELRMALGFTVMLDGTAVVLDVGHQSYQLFGADGEFERMVGMGGDGMMQFGWMAPDPSGMAIISGGGGGVIAMEAGRGARAPAQPAARPIERISLAGGDVESETIAEGWRPPRGERPQTLEGGGMRFSMAMAGPRTFEPDLLVGALPNGGVTFSDSSAYAVKIAGPDGGVSRILQRPFRPLAVTDRIEEAEKERRLEEMAAGEGPQMRMRMVGPGGGDGQEVNQDAIKEMMQGQIEQMQFFPEVPVIRGLQTTWGGRIWVQRRGEQPVSDGPIDVLNTDGQYVGSFAAGEMEMPSSFGPDGLTAYIETDEFDVPTIVVRKLPSAVN